MDQQLEEDVDHQQEEDGEQAVDAQYAPQGGPLVGANVLRGNAHHHDRLDLPFRPVVAVRRPVALSHLERGVLRPAVTAEAAGVDDDGPGHIEVFLPFPVVEPRQFFEIGVFGEPANQIHLVRLGEVLLIQRVERRFAKGVVGERRAQLLERAPRHEARRLGLEDRDIGVLLLVPDGGAEDIDGVSPARLPEVQDGLRPLADLRLDRLLLVANQDPRHQPDGQGEDDQHRHA